MEDIYFTIMQTIKSSESAVEHLEPLLDEHVSVMTEFSSHDGYIESFASLVSRKEDKAGLLLDGESFILFSDIVTIQVKDK